MVLYDFPYLHKVYNVQDSPRSSGCVEILSEPTMRTHGASFPSILVDPFPCDDLGYNPPTKSSARGTTNNQQCQPKLRTKRLPEQGTWKGMRAWNFFLFQLDFHFSCQSCAAIEHTDMPPLTCTVSHPQPDPQAPAKVWMASCLVTIRWIEIH